MMDIEMKTLQAENCNGLKKILASFTILISRITTEPGIS